MSPFSVLAPSIICLITVIATTLGLPNFELNQATVNSHSAVPSILATLVSDQIKENGFIFLNDSTIGNTITVNTNTNTIVGLEKLSHLVTNISKLYFHDLSNNSDFCYALGNVAGRRELAKGINKVSGAPKSVLVTAHSEASYLSHAPLYLIFACPGIPDISSGGQTIVYSIDKIVDRLMQSQIGRNLLNEVAKYGVIYVRNDPSLTNAALAKIWKGVKYPVWQQRFESGMSKAQITQFLIAHNQTVSWIGDGNDTLRTQWHMPGFRLHPRTGKRVWFNQLYSMNGRYFEAHNVEGMSELALMDRPLHTLIGNGRALTDSEYQLLDRVSSATAVLIPWDNTGDILAIDNFAYQHGRTPYHSYRSCVINWGMAVEGGTYVYDQTHFVPNSDSSDMLAVYALLNEFEWYDTVVESVLYRNGKDTVMNGINSETFSVLKMEEISPIYSDILKERLDINVIIHVNSPNIASIAQSNHSFLAIDQSYYMLYPITKADANTNNIANVLGMESKLVLIGNRGMIVCGHRFDEAFTRLFYAIRAAESQILALAIHRNNVSNIIFPSSEIQQITIDQSLNFNSDGYGYLEFIAWKRRYNSHQNKAVQLHTIEFESSEYELRESIARAYHILDRLGWTESIYQHITAVLPTNNNQMLINAYGLEFGEVSVTNLMTVTMNGTVVYEGDSARKGYINPSGLALHAAVHESRADAKIVIHCHHSAISAVSVYKHGLVEAMISDNYKALIGEIGYHNFDSLSLAINRTVLGHLLSSGNNVIILRNHGILTVGESVKDAFNRLYYTILAAQSQIQTMISNDNFEYNTYENSDCELKGNKNKNSNYYNAWDRFSKQSQNVL